MTTPSSFTLRELLTCSLVSLGFFPLPSWSTVGWRCPTLSYPFVSFIRLEQLGGQTLLMFPSIHTSLSFADPLFLPFSLSYERRTLLCSGCAQLNSDHGTVGYLLLSRVVSTVPLCGSGRPQLAVLTKLSLRFFTVPLIFPSFPSSLITVPSLQFP